MSRDMGLTLESRAIGPLFSIDLLEDSFALLGILAAIRARGIKVARAPET
jgi:hypothetical protein